MDASGPVRSLSRRLADHIKNDIMTAPGAQNAAQAGFPTDSERNVVKSVPRPRIIPLMGAVEIDPAAFGFVTAGIFVAFGRTVKYFAFVCQLRGDTRFGTG